jgi:hypothetical protein
MNTKVSVHRRVFWGISQTTTRAFLHRFETARSRDEWLKISPIHSKGSASCPVIRKINRRIAGGEKVEFPVEIG